MPKNKFYVVWVGRKPGIYSTWDSCKAQVDGFEGAKYKGFPTIELAKSASQDNFQKYLTKDPAEPKKILFPVPGIGVPVPDSICVDAACKGNPGIMEYRGVDTKSGAELFHQGPFPEGTNNIGEFLAIVHALGYLKKQDLDWPVYSDSRNAIKWIGDRAMKTKLKRTAKNENLFSLCDRALTWLHKNKWENRVLKWETKYWGEIPADFGRK